jgi:transposase
VDPEPIPGPPARKREALEEERLPAQTESSPDLLTLAEHCELFEEESGVEVSTATMSRALKRLGLPLKKSRSRLPSETRRRGLAGEKERGR